MSIDFLNKYNRYRIGKHDVRGAVVPVQIIETITVPAGISTLFLREKIYFNEDNNPEIVVYSYAGVAFTRVDVDVDLNSVTNSYKVSTVVDGLIELNSKREEEIDIGYQGVGTIVGERFAKEVCTMNEHNALLENIPNPYPDTVFIGGVKSQGPRGVEIGVGIGNKNGTSSDHVNIGPNNNTNGNKTVVMGAGNDAQGDLVTIVGARCKTFFLPGHGQIDIETSAEASIIGNYNTINVGAIKSNIVGAQNTIENQSTHTNIMGYKNIVKNNGNRSGIIGSENTITDFVGKSFIVGDSNEILDRSIYALTFGSYNITTSDMIQCGVFGNGNKVGQVNPDAYNASTDGYMKHCFVVGNDNNIKKIISPVSSQTIFQECVICVGTSNDFHASTDYIVMGNNNKIEEPHRFRGPFVGNTLIGNNNNINFNSDNNIVIANNSEDKVTQSVIMGNYNFTGVTPSGVEKSVLIGVGINGITYYKDSVVIGYKQTLTSSDGRSVVIGCYGKVGAIAVQVGPNGAAGNAAVSVGSYANAADYAVSVGRNADARGKYSISMGEYSRADKDYGISIGKGSHSSKEQSVAIGYKSKAWGDHSVAVGPEAEALEVDATAFGHNAKARGKHSSVFGDGANTEATHTYSTAIGFNANTTAAYQMVLGTPAITVKLGSGLTVTSDARDKADIKKSTLGLEFILLLEPKEYRCNPHEEYYKKEVVYHYDDYGNKILDENGEPIFTERYATIEVPVLDASGNPIIDEVDEEQENENGEIVIVKKQVPRMQVVKDKSIDLEALKRGDRKYKRLHHGLIAQDVIEALKKIGDVNLDKTAFICREVKGDDDPNVYEMDKRSVLSMRYEELFAPIINSIKELNARLEALEAA